MRFLLPLRLRLRFDAHVLAVGMTALTLVCCPLFTGQVRKDLAACASTAVEQALEPTVRTILMDGPTNWNDQLRALESLGLDAVICAVKTIVAQLSSPQAAGPGLMAGPGAAALQRAELYLAQRHAS